MSFINQTPLHHIAELAIADALAFFQGLNLTGQRGKNRRKNPQRN